MEQATTINPGTPSMEKDVVTAAGATADADSLHHEPPSDSPSDAGPGQTAFVPIVGTALGVVAFLFGFPH